MIELSEAHEMMTATPTHTGGPHRPSTHFDRVVAWAQGHLWLHDGDQALLLADLQWPINKQDEMHIIYECVLARAIPSGKQIWAEYSSLCACLHAHMQCQCHASYTNRHDITHDIAHDITHSLEVCNSQSSQMLIPGGTWWYMYRHAVSTCLHMCGHVNERPRA